MSEPKLPKSPIGNRDIHFSGEVIALASDLRDLVVELSRYTDTPEQNQLLLEMVRKIQLLRNYALEHQSRVKQPKNFKGEV